MSLELRHYHSATGASLFIAMYDNLGGGAILSSGDLQFSAYTSAAHATFCHAMTENTERTFLYEFSHAQADVLFPKTPIGRPYTYEIWDGNTNRSDTLVSTGNFYWSGKNTQEFRLDTTDIEAIKQKQAISVISYDSASETVRIIGWLEDRGVVVTNPTDITIEWWDRDGNILFAVTRSDQFLAGFFQFEFIPGNPPVPDDATIIKTRVTDADGVEWASGTGVASWD